MARIRYDRYLLDEDQLVTITNADTDYLTKTVPESFTNPPIRMKFQNIDMISFETMCHNAINDDEIVIDDKDVLRMVRGELPGWRLVGAEFEPDNGFSAYYANENPMLQLISPDAIRQDYRSAEGVSFHFLAGRGCLEVELEVDYADGLPIRRYVGNVTDNNGKYVTEVTEYFGKRKIRKLEFAEGEYGDKNITGRLCHVTEY